MPEKFKIQADQTGLVVLWLDLVDGSWNLSYETWEGLEKMSISETCSDVIHLLTVTLPETIGE